MSLRCTLTPSRSQYPVFRDWHRVPSEAFFLQMGLGSIPRARTTLCRNWPCQGNILLATSPSQLCLLGRAGSKDEMPLQKTTFPSTSRGTQFIETERTSPPSPGKRELFLYQQLGWLRDQTCQILYHSLVVKVGNWRSDKERNPKLP